MKGEHCFPFFDRFRVALVRGWSSVGSGRSELFIFDRTVGLLRAKCRPQARPRPLGCNREPTRTRRFLIRVIGTSPVPPAR
jgi:hypothetical protein